MEKELFTLVVLSCFHLCFYKRFHVNTQLGVAGHWWFNYPGSLLDVELEFTCLSGYVRPIALALYCLDSTKPLSCLVVEHLPSKQYVMGLVPPEQLFFIFHGKGVVQVSCIALF